MQEKKAISWRQMIGGLFAMMVCFGAWYQFSGRPEPGSYTWMYDMSLIGIGMVGMIVVWLWPKKKGPSEGP
jgi:hypothetical protein